MKREANLYKVVIILRDGEMVSVNDMEVIHYYFGKITVPCYGKIFCFDTIENAQGFVKDLTRAHYPNEKIIEGIGTNPSRPKLICYMKGDLKDFWTFKNMKKGVKRISKKPPKGTVWVDSFTPTKVC